MFILRNLLNHACFVLALSISNFSLAAGSASIDVQLNPVGNFTAKTNSVVGSASLDEKGMYIATNVTLKINDFNSGVELRDKHMNEEYFESTKFPEAQLIAAKGKGGKFVAKLKIHGETNKVSGTYEVQGAKLVAKFKTLLSDWKIKKASYMGVGVVDQVDVVVTLPIEK